MWLFFGIAAILTALLNLLLALRGKDGKWFRFASLSLTALTLCALYSQSAAWVLQEDWSALMDVVPSVSKTLWLLVGASIVLNGISLIRRK